MTYLAELLLKSSCHLCILELLLVELRGKGTVGREGHSNWKVINLAIVGPVEKVRLCSSGLECRQFPEGFFWSLLGVVHAEMLPWVTIAVSVRLGFLFFRQREKCWNSLLLRNGGWDQNQGPNLWKLTYLTGVREQVIQMLIFCHSSLVALCGFGLQIDLSATIAQH